MSSHTQFERFVATFLDSTHQFHPHRAMSLGLHAFDGRLPDYSRPSVAERIAELRDFEEQLAAIDPADLDGLESLDYRQLELAMQQELFEWDEARWWQRNPMFYSDALDASRYVKRSYAPLDERVRALIAHARGIPDFIATIRLNLNAELPVPYVDTAVGVYSGSLAFLENDLPRAVTEIRDRALLAELDAANRLAADALRDFVAWLRDEARPRATDQFAIGERLFRRLLWVGEMVDTPLDRLLTIGEAELARLHDRFAATADQILPGRPVADAMRSLSADHPSASQLVPAVSGMLEDLRQFIVDRGLVTVPSEVRPRVEETPPFLRWAFAMIDPAGVFEPETIESYYYVTPPETDWPREKQEQWLSKFDYYTLRDVSIHEAWPGHYLHYLHDRRAPTTVTKVFGAYSFWEGWAHYAEQMMLDEGYGKGDPRLRLAQLSEALLRASRYVAAIKMHTEGWTVDQATRFIMSNAYMEETPAQQEAVRGTFDPGFLNYTLGKLMLLRLREDYRTHSESFSLREFHDRFLSFGAPPIPLVREMMLGRARGPIL